MLSRDAQGLGTETRQPKSEAPAPTYHHIHIPFLPAGRKSRKKLRHGLYRIHSQDRQRCRASSVCSALAAARLTPA